MQPYPDSDDPRSMVKGALLAGLLVFFVLAAFKPFGLFRLGNVALWYAAQFGFVTSGISLGFDWMLYYLLGIRKDQPSWTFGKWVVSSFVLIFLIGIGNTILIHFQFGPAITFSIFLNIWFGTLLVGVVPMLIYGALQTNRKLQTYRQLASGLALPETEATRLQPQVKLGDPLHGPELEIPADRILYLESQRNYVKVVFWKGEKGEEALVRQTLSALEKQLEQTSIKRSHRSYLVNPQWITEISGNAQGLVLTLKSPEGNLHQVPVSRTYIQEFKQ
ncbi:MAG: LytTR family DNA-binding domain-containing protein [Bacteroidota bacterium]